MLRNLLLILFFLNFNFSFSQDIADKVNVLLGSAGDHGQMSPAASYPFSQLSILPQTEPSAHMGYDFNAKKVLGFTHNRIEGVGCGGAGGILLLTPVISNSDSSIGLTKKSESAGPGYYQIDFEEGLNAEFTVYKNSGIHRYSFPKRENITFKIDFTHNFEEFRDAHIEVRGSVLTGYVTAGTTCNFGAFTTYFAIDFGQDFVMMSTEENVGIINLPINGIEMEIGVALSAVSEDHAISSLPTLGFEEMRQNSRQAWNKMLGTINVKGNPETEELFYSLLYRVVQSPYLISEPDGSFRNVRGNKMNSEIDMYHGWAVWDNYRSQLPLLSLIMPDIYASIAKSLEYVYRYGRHDWALMTEPAPTVRTEHTSVVLLDSYVKGYEVDFDAIKDSLVAESSRFNYSAPDKALESCYDLWALSEILNITGDTALSEQYLDSALKYKEYWMKDFADITAGDAEILKARGLYQGTVWQYRWSVPMDVAGMVELAGGREEFIRQLDYFFENDLYNHGNQPDLHAAFLYQAAGAPWKAQDIIRKISNDTIRQIYGSHTMYEKPFVDRIYRNLPDGYMYEMDDDLGCMSGWYVFTAIGLFPACVGTNVYYINTPLFEEAVINYPGGEKFTVKCTNFSMEKRYIQSAKLNGKKLNRNWLRHDEIVSDGKLELELSDKPNKNWGTEDIFVTRIKR